MRRLAVFGLLITCAVVPLAAADPLRTATYRGALNDDPEASVAFELTTRAGVPTKAKFEADRFPILCEGDAAPLRISHPRVTVEFLGPRVFEGRVIPPPRGGLTELFKLQGRLLGDGRARGFIFYSRDGYDPPDEPENDAECSTDGLLRWTADRVG